MRRLAVLALCAALAGCAKEPPSIVAVPQEAQPVEKKPETQKRRESPKPLPPKPNPQCKAKCKSHFECHVLAMKTCGEDTPYTIDDEPADGPFMVCKTCK